jgi:hypothetical protein
MTVSRGIILVLSLLIAPIVSKGQEVVLTLDLPSQITAGEEVRVDLAIQKGTLNGFARFQQEIPAGITVSPIQTVNGDFTFENGRINLIWLKLPAQPELQVSYNIKADARVKGFISLGGKFSYLSNNDRNDMELEDQNVSIQPAPGIDPALVVDIRSFKEVLGAEQAAQTQQQSAAQTEQTRAETPVQAGQQSTSKFTERIHLFRQQPYRSQSNDSYIVNVIISKGSLEKFSRLEEEVLSGYDARAINAYNSIFSFEGGVAKFLWMKLPEEPVFAVSYELTPRTAPISEKPKIKGLFSFIVEGEPYEVPVSERIFTLTDKSQATLAGIVDELVIDEKYIEPYPKVGGESQPVTAQTLSPAANVAVPVTVKTPVQETTSTATSVDGVVFKVQLGAFSKQIPMSQFNSRFKINEAVEMDRHEGMYKYVTGSFSKYSDARQYLTRIQSATGIREAFVCAYQDGKRITVKQALKVTGQKWSK